MYKQYSTKADDPSFWEDHWKARDIHVSFESAKNSELIPIFQKHLPSRGKILEAGCGQGIFVHALKNLGYNIEGIDFDGHTIARVKEHYPDLPIQKGDVFALEYADNSLTGYISLGVIEHYQDSWRKPIREAHRVLSPGGKLMLAVPFYGLGRRLALPRKSVGDNFYQYFFTRKEITSAVRDAGFSIETVEYYGKAKVLMSLPLIGARMRRIYEGEKKKSVPEQKAAKSKKAWSIKQFLFSLIPDSLFGHMIMVIAIKK